MTFTEALLMNLIAGTLLMLGLYIGLRVAGKKREAMEVELRRAQKAQKVAILATAQDAVVEVNERDGTIESVNERAVRLFRWPEGLLIGQPVEVLVPDAVAAIHVEHRRRFLESPRPRPMGLGMTLHARCYDGAVIPVEVGLTPNPGEGVTIAVVKIPDRRKQNTPMIGGRRPYDPPAE